MSRSRLVLFVVVGIPLLYFLWHIGLRVPLELVVHLGFGWLIFLFNVVPAMTVRWSSVFTAIAALIVFVVGIQRLAVWLRAARKAANDGAATDSPGTWPWRWTILATALMVIMFVAGIAVVGMAHQVAWMVTSKEPMTENNFIQFRRTESRRKLNELGLALHRHLEQEGRFPAGGTFTERGEPLHSWQTALLPFIDQKGLFERIDQTVPWDSPRNRAAMETVVSEYLNPALSSSKAASSAGPAPSHYAGNGWVLGGGRPLRMEDVSDGLSNTLLSGEVNTEFKPWGHPLNWRDPMRGINRVPDGFGSPFHLGAHFLLGDGSVRYINDTIDATVLKALATPNGGEPTGNF